MKDFENIEGIEVYGVSADGQKKQLDEGYLVVWESGEEQHGLATNCTGELMANAVHTLMRELTKNAPRTAKRLAFEVLLDVKQAVDDRIDNAPDTEE